MSFGGKWQTSLDDPKVLQSASSQIGLLLNVKNYEVTAFGDESDSVYKAYPSEFSSIHCVTFADATLLGAGLGKEEVRAELQSKLRGVRTLIKRTENLPRQTAFFLIKNCFFVPKSMFVLISSPTFYHLDLLPAMDGGSNLRWKGCSKASSRHFLSSYIPSEDGRLWHSQHSDHLLVSLLSFDGHYGELEKCVSKPRPTRDKLC